MTTKILKTEKSYLVALILIFLATIVFPHLACGSEADYRRLLAESKVDEKPNNHAILAKWCEKNFPSKHKFHLHQYNLYQFKLKEEKLPEKPSLTQLAAMYTLAQKIESQEMYVKYHDQWGRLMAEEKISAIKDGDKKKTQQTLDWLIANDLSHLTETITLSEKYFQANPDDDLLRRKLSFIKLDGAWVLPTNLDEKWYGEPDLRMQLHEQLSATEKAKGPSKKIWESDPIRGFATVRGCKVKGTDKSKGDSRYFIYADPVKDPSKPRPILISFHGGGGGGEEFAEEQGSIALRSMINVVPGAVVLAPIAKIHINNSWGHKANVADWLDALDEVCEMYHIDRKRIYLFGYSMGSKAIAQYSCLAPELGAAYALGGCSTGIGAIPDKYFKDKPFMVFHGLKEESWRTSMKNKLVDRVKESGAKLEVFDFPDYGHDLPHSQYNDKITATFNKSVNPIEPNLGVIRHLFMSRFKEIKQATP